MSATPPRLTLDDVLDPAALAAEINAGYVTRKPHPHLPLGIYTYSRGCQYENRWNPTTMRCRGLVADDTGEIVALPFGKFFNISMHGALYPFAPPLPAEDFEVYDKLDGSLGIAFHFDGRWHVASKGSFTSEQAVWATTRLRNADHSRLYPDYTYLAEIIYPENRIVVDYGHRKDLVLLAAVRCDGQEMDLDRVASQWAPIGSVVRRWPSARSVADVAAMMTADARLDGDTATGTDAEGYVIRFTSGVRVKAKFASYVRLHKILTGVTPREIWKFVGVDRYGATATAKDLAKALTCSPAEAAALLAVDGGPLAALIEQVPDEFDRWVRGVIAGIEARAAALRAEVDATFTATSGIRHDRRAFADHVRTVPDPVVRAAMFLLLDGKPVDLHIWRAVKPDAAKPFTEDEEG